MPPKGAAARGLSSSHLCMLLALCSCMLLMAAVWVTPANILGGPSPKPSGAAAAVAVAGRREVLDGGTELVWQLPQAQQAKGLLLALHGCKHGAPDFWPTGPACKECIGLPEEVRITRTALARGYGVLAISSKDREGAMHSCWEVPKAPGQPSADTQAVVSAVRKFVTRNKLQDVPMFALGVSSGGAFALTLPRYLQLAGVCSQVMALPRPWYRGFLQPGNDTAPDSAGAGEGSANTTQPPVLFVHMSRDTHTATGVDEDMQLRNELGLVSHVIAVAPQPVTPAFLARVPELGGEAARAELVAMLKAQGVLDEAGLLKGDPRKTQWRQVVADSSIAGASTWTLAADKSGLSEALNVAYASHEIVSDTTDEMLSWWEKQAKEAAAAKATAAE